MGKRNPVHCCGECKLVEFLTIEISIKISQNTRNKATIQPMSTTLGHMPKDILQQILTHASLLLQCLYREGWPA